MADTEEVVRNAIEVLGKTQTQPASGAQHDATVDGPHLWSYAQEAALLAVSERKQGADHYTLITSPERRSMRIAANYADLYFASAEKTNKKMQFYWCGLAAFVVKDIKFAYQYVRENVLKGNWRSWSGPTVGSMALSHGSTPFEHALRTYDGLNKGNLWLFQDIFPSLWFYLTYAVTKDGQSTPARVDQYASTRNWNTYQTQAKQAIEQLPFNRPWMGRLKSWLAADPVYAQASDRYQQALQTSAMSTTAPARFAANSYMKQHQAQLASNDHGFMAPPSNFWPNFAEPYTILDEMRREWTRLANDGAAAARLDRVKLFPTTADMRQAFTNYTQQMNALNDAQRKNLQQTELVVVARQEQLNVLQPLIYDDQKLKETLDLNHYMSRNLGEWASAPIRVVFSAEASTDDESLRIDFDPSEGVMDSTGRLFRDMFGKPKKSLSDPADRMDYVNKIAAKFNKLMDRRRPYMEAQLRIIAGGLGA